MIQSALIKWLRTIVGNGRVYANVTKKDCQLPAITVDFEGEYRNKHWTNGVTTTGRIESDFEISIWGNTSDSIRAIAETIISTIDNFSGDLTDLGSPQTIYRVLHVDITSSSSDFDGETEQYAHSIFITITHTT